MEVVKTDRQEDAHEYMVNLLESMHKCCLPSGVPSESPSAYEKSLVHKIFGGRLRSQVKCMQCSYCSNKFDPFLDLSLEIVKADSCYKALVKNDDSVECNWNNFRVLVCKILEIPVSSMRELGISRNFRKARQEDAHEYMVNLLESMHKCCLPSGVPSESPSAYEKSLVHKIFGGRLRSQVAPTSEKRVLEQQAYMFFYVHDRRNIVPRKPPTDVAQKDNLKAKANGNRTSSTFNQGSKETVQNGPVEKQLNSATPAAAIRKDASNGVPSMAPLVKEASVQKDNGLSPWPKKDSVSENFSKAPLSNNPPEGLPVSNPKLIEGLSPSASSCNGDVPNFGSTAKGKIDDYNEKGKLKTDLRVSVAMSPSFNDAQSSSTAKNVTDETSHKVGHTPNVGALGNSLVEAAGVSHWDGIELPRCQTAASNDVESTSMGYVLDEW
ncbi:ubiquitin carboxyl-terminal hydrolase 23-like [Fagus crenata]